jgi:putative inorganic carbon (HCO3(-)) transporter
MNSSALVALGVMFGLIVSVAGLFRPFLGMLVFIFIHFVQPAELIPALAPFRIELVYGTLLIGILIYRRTSLPGPSILSDRIIRGAIILLGVSLLSVPLSVWRGGAAETVIELTKLIALIFLLTTLVDSAGRLRKTVWCMAAVSAWFAASSLFAFAHGQFYALKYDWGSLDRAEGVNSIVGGANELAGLLLALLPLLIALLRTTRNVLARILLVACGALSLAAISLTGSRIAMIGLIAMVIYYTIQSKHKLLTGISCVLIGCLVWFNLPGVYKQRYLTVESYAQGGQLDASNEFRLEVWRVGEQIFFQRPILGVGAGQFPTAYGLIYLAGRHAAWMNPHNLLIQVACELGLIGLAAFVYFMCQVAKGIRSVLRRKRNCGFALSYQVAIACSVMYVGVLILSLVGHTLYRPYWYLLAGLVAANRNIAYSKLKERAKLGVVSSDKPQALDGLEPSFARLTNEFEGAS